MIVEFSGLPGSGKSFLARHLVAELQRSGTRAADGLDRIGPNVATGTRLLRKARLAARSVLGEPARSVRSVRAIAGSGQPVAQAVRRTQNWLVVRRRMAEARATAGVHVFDQGVVQELHSLAYAGRWRDAVAPADPGTRRVGPDLLVSLRVTPELAARRLAGRTDAGSRLDRMPAAARLPWLAERAVELVTVEDAWLGAHAAAVPTTRLVLEVTDDDPATLAELTRRMLEAVRSAG